MGRSPDISRRSPGSVAIFHDPRIHRLGIWSFGVALRDGQISNSVSSWPQNLWVIERFTRRLHLRKLYSAPAGGEPITGTRIETAVLWAAVAERAGAIPTKARPPFWARVSGSNSNFGLPRWLHGESIKRFWLEY